MNDPTVCNLCNIRQFEPAKHHCDVHGTFCTRCSLINEQCPECYKFVQSSSSSTPFKDPRFASPASSSINDTKKYEWDEDSYTGENPIMEHVKALRAKQQAKISENERARRRRYLQRRKNRTKFRQPSPIFAGNTRPG